MGELATKSGEARVHCKFMCKFFNFWTLKHLTPKPRKPLPRWTPTYPVFFLLFSHNKWSFDSACVSISFKWLYCIENFLRATQSFCSQTSLRIIPGNQKSGPRAKIQKKFIINFKRADKIPPKHDALTPSQIFFTSTLRRHSENFYNDIWEKNGNVQL